MSEPRDLTRGERDELRRRHSIEARAAPGMAQWCRCCAHDYPCPTVRAVDEIERLCVLLAWCGVGPSTADEVGAVRKYLRTSGTRWMLRWRPSGAVASRSR